MRLSVCPILLCFLSLSVLSQSPEDSLKSLLKNAEGEYQVKILSQLCWEYSMKDHNQALNYGYKALELSKEKGFEAERATALNNLGIVYEYKGQYDSALSLYQRSLDIRLDLEDMRGAAASLHNLGIIHKNEGNYDKALELTLKSLELEEKLGNEKGIAGSYNNVGLIYKNLNNTEKAKEYYVKALKIREKIGDKEDIATSLNNLGLIYKAEGDYNSAIAYYEKSLSIREQLGNLLGIASCLNNIGGGYYHLGQIAKATTYYVRSLEVYEDLGDVRGMAITTNNLGEMYLELKEIAKGIEYFDQSLKLSKEINFANLITHTYNSISNAYVAQGSFEEAVRYHQLYADIKDSIFNVQNAKQLAEIQTKYDTGKRKLELEVQDIKIVEQNLEIARKRNQMGLLFGGIILLALAGLIIYSKQRQKQKEIQIKAERDQRELRLKSVIEGEEKERKRLAVDLHDGLGQVLSTVRLNVSSLEDQEETKPVTDVLGLIDNGIDELREISHNLMPSALIKLGLVPALKELTDKINNSGDLKVHFQTHALTTTLVNSIEISLYRVVQEILNGALKHSQASSITLQMLQENDNLNIMIEDNGIGVDLKNSERPAGVDWDYISSRIVFLSGDLDIDSYPKSGTSINIDIPIQ